MRRPVRGFPPFTWIGRLWLCLCSVFIRRIVDHMTLLLGVLGSNVFTAFLMHLLGKKKSTAEVKTMDVNVAQTAMRMALDLEERSTTRYKSAQDALDVAQLALNAARAEIRGLEDYITFLHDMMDAAGIKYPDKNTVLS